jgi:putative flippase GtrA
MTKYIIVGTCAVIIHNASFYTLFTIIKTPLFIETIFSLVAGLVVSFIGNKVWIFSALDDNAEHKHKKQLVLYGALFWL